MSLATKIHAEQAAFARSTRAPNSRLRYNISPRERAVIVKMLSTDPLPAVEAKTGRALSTLCKIAEVARANGEL